MKGCKEFNIYPSVIRRVIFQISHMGYAASLGMGGALVWDYGMTLADKKVFAEHPVGYSDPWSIITKLTVQGFMPYGYQKPFFKSHKKWN